MGEQADIIKGSGGIPRNVDSLPCVATSHTWGPVKGLGVRGRIFYYGY